MSDLAQYVRSISGFPKEGIVFRDITTLLKVPQAMQEVIERMAASFDAEEVDMVVAPEARGFIFGAAVAARLDAGFVPVRKPGKLPAETIEETYELEYGTDTVAMHRDAIQEGCRALLVDDLLATGGTMAACCRLVENLGGIVTGCVFLIELSFLKGRDALSSYRVVSLIDYPAEES